MRGKGTARPKLISLNRRREYDRRIERQYCKAWLVGDARQMPDDIDGYALVAFKNDGTRATTYVRYLTRNPLDKARLPDLCRHELDRIIGDDVRAGRAPHDDEPA